MALTNAFYDAVNSSNVKYVRIMMKDSLIADPTFEEFEEMRRKAEAMYGLYDEHDGVEFDLDRTHWNEGYMNMLMVQLIGNFSHERIEHLKNVIRYLYPEAAAEKRNNRIDYRESGYKSGSGMEDTAALIIGAAVGAIAIGTVGGVMFGTIGAVIGAAGGAVAGGYIGKEVLGGK